MTKLWLPPNSELARALRGYQPNPVGWYDPHVTGVSGEILQYADLYYATQVGGLAAKDLSGNGNDLVNFGCVLRDGVYQNASINASCRMSSAFSGDHRTIGIEFFSEYDQDGGGTPQSILARASTYTTPYLILGEITGGNIDETFTYAQKSDGQGGGLSEATYIRDRISRGWHRLVMLWDSSVSHYRIFLDGQERVVYNRTSANHGHLLNGYRYRFFNIQAANFYYPGGFRQFFISITAIPEALALDWTRDVNKYLKSAANQSPYGITLAASAAPTLSNPGALVTGQNTATIECDVTF